MKHVKSLLGGALCILFLSGNIQPQFLSKPGFGKYGIFPHNRKYSSHELINLSHKFQSKNQDLITRMKKKEETLLNTYPKWKKLNKMLSSTNIKFMKVMKTAQKKLSDTVWIAGLHPTAKKAYEKYKQTEKKVEKELGKPEKVWNHPRVKAAFEKYHKMREEFPELSPEEVDKLSEVKDAQKEFDNTQKKLDMSKIYLKKLKLESKLLQPVYKELRKHAPPEIIKLQDQYDSAIDKVLGEK